MEILTNSVFFKTIYQNAQYYLKNAKKEKITTKHRIYLATNLRQSASCLSKHI